MKKSNQAEQLTGYTSVAKKFAMALSGLGLVGFIIIHLLGNLALYRREGTSFNAYAHSLESLGSFLIVAEVLLLLVFVLHILTGFGLKFNHMSARPKNYRMWRSKGGPTPSNLSSRNMIISGVILLVFLVIHVWQFRFGPGVAQGYVTQVHGEEARDLYRLVVETFKNPGWTAFYMFCMVLLGMHLRHGFWSAFQSLGVTRGTASRKLLIVSAGVGLLLGLGFFLIPIWIYFFV